MDYRRIYHSQATLPLHTHATRETQGDGHDAKSCETHRKPTARRGPHPYTRNLPEGIPNWHPFSSRNFLSPEKVAGRQRASRCFPPPVPVGRPRRPRNRQSHREAVHSITSSPRLSVSVHVDVRQKRSAGRNIPPCGRTHTHTHTHSPFSEKSGACPTTRRQDVEFSGRQCLSDHHRGGHQQLSGGL